MVLAINVKKQLKQQIELTQAETDETQIETDALNTKLANLKS
jgi:hypothetical protein